MPFDFEGRTEEEIRRYYLWEPCEDKQALHDWIYTYLGIDFPDSVVDIDSNCSPMDMVWELYDKSMRNDPDFYRVMYYANRGGGKTLGASIFEALAILHLNRSVVHMAAIGQQSEKAQEYLKGFYRMPYLRDFVVGDNNREVIVIRWYNPVTCETLTQKEYSNVLKGNPIKGFSVRGNISDFVERSEYVRIIMATVRSTNGEHALLFCADGGTKIQCRFTGDNSKNGRLRKTRTARGVFRALQGIKNGGRPHKGEEAALKIETPAGAVEMLSLNQKTGEWEFVPVLRAERKKEPVFVLSTQSGKRIRCTASHRLYTSRGFVELKDLKIGEPLLSVGKSQTNKKALSERDHSYVPYKAVGGKSYFYLRGGVEAKRRLEEVCSEHIHPDMRYKFDTSRNRSTCDVCGKEFWFYHSGSGSSNVCDSATCRMVDKGSLLLDKVVGVEPDGEDWVYDFSLGKNHNYISNGLISHNCADEVDIIENPAAYEEAKNIPEPRDGKNPITFLISTRKYSFGLVQKEIDEAHKSGLQVRHWNAIDMTQACPPDRHRPDLPKIPIYRSEEQLHSISEEAWSLLSEPEREKFVREEGFEGCIKNCRLYAACKGRLATHQHCKSSMLKPISSTQNQFAINSLEMQKTQLLCLKPASTGLIYGSLDRSKHILTPAQAYEMMTGDPPADKFMDKSALLQYVSERDYRWYAGMDFGFSHLFAVTAGFVFGNTMFITHAIAMPELEPHQQVAVCEPLKRFEPIIYPDTENPQMIKVFRKAGFKVHDWTKKKGTVLGGIDIVRMKLNPGGGQRPQMFFVRDDDDSPIDFLFENLQKYHWKIDASGNPSNIPDDTDDDLADSTRYLIMNVFEPKGRISVAAESERKEHKEEIKYSSATWMRDIIRDRIGDDNAGYSYYKDANDKKKPDEKGPTGKKGGLTWDLS